MARGRLARSRPTEGEASSNHEASSPREQTDIRAQTASSSRPVSRHTTTTAQPQNEVVAQLLLALLAIQGAIERLAGNQVTQPPVSTPVPPVMEPVVDEAAQGTTPANADISSAMKRPIALAEEPSQYFTKAEVEAMLKKERERAATAPTVLDLKPPYPEKVLEKDFPAEYKVPKFQKFDGRKGNTKEHVARSSTL